MLYHQLYGFPDSLELKEGYVLEPKYSVHAQKSAKEDRYGQIKLPKEIKFSQRQVIEVESKDGIKVDKVVVRVPYDRELDLCLVILLGSKICKTCWINKRSDKHLTLDKSKYNLK